MLAAGIDVYSTVNVQHLESLNDQVAELTGTRVRETVPDAVLSSADDVVLIDITPQSLIERLRAGKIYPVERVEAALNNFFKVENLASLREVALRQVAEEVELKRIPSDRGNRGRDERLVDTAAPQAIGERLLALVTPRPESQRIVRRAWRSAQRLGAELDILWVADHEPSELEREQVAGAAPAGLGARCPPARGARRRCRGDGCPGCRRPRDDLCADGDPEAANGACAASPSRRCRSDCSDCFPAWICASSPTAPR